MKPASFVFFRGGGEAAPGTHPTSKQESGWRGQSVHIDPGGRGGSHCGDVMTSLQLLLGGGRQPAGCAPRVTSFRTAPVSRDPESPLIKVSRAVVHSTSALQKHKYPDCPCLSLSQTVNFFKKSLGFLSGQLVIGCLAWCCVLASGEVCEGVLVYG